jgi:hypothetical protein
VKEDGVAVGDADIVTLDCQVGILCGEAPDTEINLSFDGTELDDVTFGNNTTGTWTFDAGGATNPTLAYADALITLSHLTVTNQLTASAGITIPTTNDLTVGVVRWDNGADAIDGEVIADDTIDDDSIDFGDVTGADLTLTDATTITASGLITANLGLTVATTQALTVGVVRWDNGADAIDGEIIADDTIDDDSIDFGDVTGADITLTDAGQITTSADFTVSLVTPDIILDDTDGADGLISVDAIDANDAVLELGVDDSEGADTVYIQLDGQNDRIDLLQPTYVGTTLGFYSGAVRWDNGADAIDGEAIADDTIDDDSIDFGDVTAADITLTDAGQITTSAILTVGYADATIRLDDNDATDWEIRVDDVGNSLEIGSSAGGVGDNVELEIDEDGDLHVTNELYVGSSPADGSGTIRLPNAGTIVFEDAVEANITHVDNTGFTTNLSWSAEHLISTDEGSSTFPVRPLPPLRPRQLPPT